MSVFKRLCAIVFVLADLAALAALALTWYGPWTSAASALFAVGEYSLAVVACLAISAFGLLVLLLRLMLFCHIFPIFHKIFDGSAKQFAFVKLFGVT